MSEQEAEKVFKGYADKEDLDDDKRIKMLEKIKKELSVMERVHEGQAKTS